MEVIILIGLQGAGKSTFYRTRFAGSHVHVSKDALRNNKRPARRQAQLIEDALRQGCSVVVDNTNPTIEDRAAIVELARAYGATVVGYYFASLLDLCLERNRQRHGRERVPDVALYATLKRLARPTFAEGFDRLYYVRSAEDGTCEIDRWMDEDV